MNHHQQNRKLINGGFAKDISSANKLRQTIKDQNLSIEKWMTMQAQPSVAPTGTTAGANEMSEIRALMSQDGLSFVEAKALRKQLLESQVQIIDFLQADAAFAFLGENAKVSPLALAKKAGELITLAGTVDKATKALEIYAQLHSLD